MTEPSDIKRCLNTAGLQMLNVKVLFGLDTVLNFPSEVKTSFKEDFIWYVVQIKSLVHLLPHCLL